MVFWFSGFLDSCYPVSLFLSMIPSFKFNIYIFFIIFCFFVWIFGLLLFFYLNIWFITFRVFGFLILFSFLWSLSSFVLSYCFSVYFFLLFWSSDRFFLVFSLVFIFPYSRFYNSNFGFYTPVALVLCFSYSLLILISVFFFFCLLDKNKWSFGRLFFS